MEKTKEELQAQIDICLKIEGCWSEISMGLKKQLQSAKSIQDIQKQAFEDARKEKDPEMYIMYNYMYETFEDYLKSKENE